PVRHCMTYCYIIPYDLHVLATPPAFVLSQDQTLRKSSLNIAPLSQSGESSNSLGSNKSSAKRECLSDRHVARRSVTHQSKCSGETARHWRSQVSSPLAAGSETPHSRLRSLFTFQRAGKPSVRHYWPSPKQRMKKPASRHPNGIPRCRTFNSRL